MCLWHATKFAETELLVNCFLRFHSRTFKSRTTTSTAQSNKTRREPLSRSLSLSLSRWRGLKMAFGFATAAAMPKPCLSIRANKSSSLDISDLADDRVSRSKKNFVFIINPKGFSFFSSLFSSSISSLLRFFTLSLNLG